MCARMCAICQLFCRPFQYLRKKERNRHTLGRGLKSLGLRLDPFAYHLVSVAQNKREYRNRNELRPLAPVVSSCGVLINSSACCWGWGAEGELGDGQPAGDVFLTAPAGVVGPAEGSPALSFSTIAASTYHTCGVASDGLAFCWGSGMYGRLGQGTTTSSSRPVAVSGSVRFTAISLGFGHSCGLERTTGKAWCWGAHWAQWRLSGSGVRGARPGLLRIRRNGGGLTEVQDAGGAHDEAGPQQSQPRALVGYRMLHHLTCPFMCTLFSKCRNQYFRRAGDWEHHQLPCAHRCVG